MMREINVCGKSDINVRCCSPSLNSAFYSSVLGYILGLGNCSFFGFILNHWIRSLIESLFIQFYFIICAPFELVSVLQHWMFDQ